MGIIIDRLKELEPILTHLISISNEYGVAILNIRMWRTVYDAFLLLKPLSHKYNVIRHCSPDEEGISLGRWIKIRYSRHMYGVDIFNKDEFFTVVRAYGDEMVEYVRSSIRDEFIKLVELTKRLEPYKEKKYYLNVDKHIINMTYDDKLVFTPLHILKVEVRNTNPSIIILITDEGTEYKFSIDVLRSIPALEYVLDEVLRIYEQIKQDVTSIKERNAIVLEEINRTILPRKLSKEMRTDNQ